MPERLETQVSAQIADPSSFGSGRLLWEREAGTPPIGTDIARLYPATGLSGLRVKANIGTATRGSFGEFERTEVVQFSGPTASTTYPIVSLLSYRNFGMLFDVNGNAVGGGSAALVTNAAGGTTQLTMSGGRNGLTANIGVYGAVEVTYRTNYYKYYYEPLIVVVPGPRGPAGVSVTKGFLAAFENGNVAIYEVPLTGSDDRDDKEVYRIVSDAVINEDGAWEIPEGWTGRTGSPTFSSGNPDPNKPSITHERVHEVGALTPAGSFFTKRYNVRIEQPYVGSFSYLPTFKIKISTPGQNGITAADLSNPTVQAGIASAQDRFGI